MSLNPSNLITVGVYGATCFVLVALIGVMWQQFAISPIVTEKPVVALHSPATVPLQPSSANQRTSDPLQRIARNEFDRYLNGQIVDLLSEIERIQFEWANQDTKSAETLIQSLLIARQRTKGVFGSLQKLTERYRDDPVVQPTDWMAPPSLEPAISTAISELEDVQKVGRTQALADLPSAARFSIAVGEFSIWVHEKREILATPP